MPPKFEEWKKHFPVGVWIAQEEVRQRNQDNTTNTTNANPGGQTHWKRVLDHPEQGIRTNHLNYSMFASQQPYNWEDVQEISGYLDTEPTGPTHYHYWGPTGRTTLATVPPSGIDGDWAVRSSANQTYADALTFVSPIIDNFKEHPSILGYQIADDVVAATAPKWLTLMRAMQDLDPYGRPVVFPCGDPAVWSLSGSEYMKIAMFSRYPVGKTTAGVPGVLSLEGDFHRNTYDAVPDYGGGGQDFVDELRRLYTTLPSSCEGRWFAVLQVHATQDSPSSLRQPTAREIRKQFWIAVGEGAKGIFWFTYDGVNPAATSPTGNSWGIGDIQNVSVLQAAADVSYRFNLATRQALLKCVRVTDLFTTSGGGSTGYPTNYPSAYKSTLQDSEGNTYLVLCNNSNATATVTVSSATLTGRLINMHDGTTFKVGGTVSLPALDGGVWRYDPYIGVPEWEPDYGTDVLTWWGLHWANPVSANYISDASFKHWPREVVVAAGGTNLQDAIDNNPDETTFRLQAGVHDFVSFTGRSHLHFIADNPASRPTCRGFLVFGSSYFEYYNGQTGATIGAQYHLRTLKTRDALYQHKYPRKDFVFKDLDFDGTGNLLTWEYRAMFSLAVPGGYWQHDHIALKQPIFMRNVRDALIQNCTFTNYVWGDDPHGGVPPAYPTPVTPTSTAGVVDGHYPAMVGGNSGLKNIVIRSCTFTGSSGSRGAPRAIFCDGSRGSVVYGNAINGKYNSEKVLFLTNDDYSLDINANGRWEQDSEYRSARYNVVANNSFDQGGNIAIAFTGDSNLVKDNTMAIGSTINNLFIGLSTRCHSTGWQSGELYRSYFNVVTGNVISGTGALLRGVTLYPISGYCVDADPDTTKYSKIGYTIVTNNTGPTTVGDWLRDDPDEPTWVSEGGDIVSGNTPT